MKKTLLLTLALVAAFSTGVCQAAPKAKTVACTACGADSRTLVSEVKAVTVDRTGGSWVIHVVGEVPTSGWKKAGLVAAFKTSELKKNIYTFRFVAAKPSGFSMPVVTQIRTDGTLAHAPKHGHVHIVAEHNSMDEGTAKK